MFVSVDHKATTAKSTYTQGSSRYTFDGLGRQSIVSAIGGDYTFQLSEKHLLSVGLKYDLMDEKLAHLTASGTVANGDITLKQKNHYSIFVAPGYQTSPDTLLYGKLSYETAKADFSGTVDRSQSDLKFGSVTYHGIGYGLGLKTYLTDDIYAGVELHRVMYDSKGLSSTSTSTGTTTGSAYLGYKF